jgi:outer membrane protein TolC
MANEGNMKTKLTKILMGICFCLCGAILPINAQTILTIDKAVEIALKNNLSLQRTRLEITGMKRRADNSWNTLVPSITASGLVNRATSLTGPVSTGQGEWIPGLSLSVALQFSPSIVTNIQQTKREYEAGLITYETARQELELQIRKLYYQILFLQSNVALMEQNVISAETRYDQTRVLSRVGKASQLDELSAQVDLQTHQANLHSAETEYTNACDALRKFLMLSSTEAITLEGSLPMPQEGIYENDLSVTQEPLAITTLRRSIELLEAQRRSAQNQAYAPTLSLSWNTSPVYGVSTPGNKAWTDNGQFSIALSFNLDNYLPRSPAREQIAGLNDTIAIQQNVLHEELLNSRSRIEQLQRNIIRSLENIEILGLTVTLAEETYKMYGESYRRGAADFQSLRSAQDSLLLAKNKALEEQYNLAAMILELEKELSIPFGSLGL